MMKKKFAGSVLVCILALIVHAQKPASFQYKVTEVALSSFDKLVVNTDINVVLLQNDTLKKAFIEGDEKLVKDIRIFIARGVMTIAADPDICYKGKVQVTVAVSNLSRLELNANAGIASLNTLQSSQLAVMVNGGCNLQLSSAGKISFTGIGGHNVQFVHSERKGNRVIEQYETWN